MPPAFSAAAKFLIGDIEVIGRRMALGLAYEPEALRRGRGAAVRSFLASLRAGQAGNDHVWRHPTCVVAVRGVLSAPSRPVRIMLGGVR